MDHAVGGAVEDVVVYREIARRVAVAPALDVRGGVHVVPLLPPSEAGKAENVVRDLAAVDQAAVLALVLIEEVFDRVDAVFDEISEVFDVREREGRAVRCDLMRYARVVDLINIAIFDYIIIAATVDLNAVSIACDASAPALGVVWICARVMLYRAADPTDLAARDVKPCSAPARRDRVCADVFKAEVIDADAGV